MNTWMKTDRERQNDWLENASDADIYQAFLEEIRGDFNMFDEEHLWRKQALVEEMERRGMGEE